MFKKALLALALVVSATGASFAQTADQTVPGYYANAPQTGCTVGPCFIPYGQTVPVSGTFSASLAGFSPTAGATANLSVSNVSSSVNLPAGADVVITNTGATDASFRLTAGAGTAVTTDQVLKAGAATGLHVLTQTVLSAITASSTTTLNVQGGTGLASGYGGGGSSAGGGTSVAQGSTTAGQSVSPMGCRTLTSAPTDTTAQTNMPWCTTKGSQVMAQPTAADLNATVVGTGTFATQLTGATNNINNVSGTVSLPTGAATAALQPTNSAQGATTSGQTGHLGMGAVTTAAPTYTTAQTSPLSLDTTGSLRVNVTAGGGTGGTSVAQASTTAGQNVSPMGCRTLTSAPTDTTAQTNMPWCTTKGSQVVAQPTAADLNATVTGTVAATQSGTWTVQPGNTANTTAWKVDGSAVTQPVSGSVSLTGATNNINNVSGTVSLPTGAATAANQVLPVAQGSTTSGQTGPLVQCSVTTAAPTYTTAQTDPVNCTTNGAIRVLDNNSAALLTAAQASIPAGSAVIGKVGIDQTTDGTTNAVHLVAGTAIAGKVGIDQTTLGTTNAVQNISGTTGGVTPFTLTAAASTNATNVKASAGTLYHIGVYNNSATLAWVSFYNTTGTPTCGTSIVYQTMIPANSTSGAGAVEDFTTGMAFSTGIGICITTGIAGTGSVAATSYVVGLGYK